VIGPDRAEILMAQLPRFDPAQLATKSDLAELRTEIRTEMREGLAAVSQRLDRLFLALLIGMLGVVAAMVGVILRIS
jgi:hypothetical protein